MRFQSDLEPARVIVRFRAIVLILAGSLAGSAAETAPDFSRDVRPLLEKHWSFLPLKSPLLPAINRAASVRTPVDRFILARLKEKKLGLSPQADAHNVLG